jgi:hypothetical protein
MKVFGAYFNIYSSSAEALLDYMLHDKIGTAVKLKNRRDARS